MMGKMLAIIIKKDYNGLVEFVLKFTLLNYGEL